MRLLFELDAKDYDPSGRAFVRPSARCIAIRGRRVAMVYSEKYDYYKFPGGGVEPGESREEAMIREAREEAGLDVVESSVRPYGYVHRAHADRTSAYDVFVQDNYYYLCEAREAQQGQMDDYEAEEGFHLVWTEPETAIETNRRPGHGEWEQKIFEREARVLELLKEEGFFGD